MSTRVTVCAPADLDDGHWRRWSSFEELRWPFPSPFTARDFVEAVARARPDTRVAVIEADGEVVGYLPHQAPRRGVATAVAHGVSDWQALVGPAERGVPAGELLRSMGAGVVRFDHLDRADVARLGGRPRAVRPSWLIEVPHGFDTYAAVQCSAHKRFASQLRKHRKLHREHEVVVVTDDRDPRSVELLRRWKSAQYRRTSRRDRFAVPWIDRLVRDLLVRHDGHVRAELASLRVDGQVVAVHLGLRRGGRLVSWFPAYDPAAAALSPGSALFFSLAATHGNRIIDLGKGDEAFKQAMANATETVAEVDLWRPSPAALGHAAVRLPPSLAERAVLSSPPARRAARSALLAVGRLRSARGDGRPYDQGQPPSPTGL